MKCGEHVECRGTRFEIKIVPGVIVSHCHTEIPAQGHTIIVYSPRSGLPESLANSQKVLYLHSASIEIERSGRLSPAEIWIRGE